MSSAFFGSLQPVTKLPGANAGREERVNSRLFELASVLARFDHVAYFIVNSDHSVM